MPQYYSINGQHVSKEEWEKARGVFVEKREVVKPVEEIKEEVKETKKEVKKAVKKKSSK